MFIITGATGNIGKHLVYAFLEKTSAAITAVTRDASKAERLFPSSVQVAEVDIADTAKLKAVFNVGDAIFVLNPPADVAGDIDREERKTVKSILEALKDIPKKILVVESTLGNQPGDHIADLGVLYELEQGIKAMHHDYHIIRPAYYMSNWKTAIAEANETGFITSFYPEDFRMPMVAPIDIAKLAADLLTNENNKQINNIVGPSEYSAADVASALSTLLQREVGVRVVDEKDWESTYEALGFSPQAANSYANMTRLSLKGGFEYPKDPIVGETSLLEYLKSVVE